MPKNHGPGSHWLRVLVRLTSRQSPSYYSGLRVNACEHFKSDVLYNEVAPYLRNCPHLDVSFLLQKFYVLVPLSGFTSSRGHDTDSQAQVRPQYKLISPQPVLYPLSSDCLYCSPKFPVTKVAKQKREFCLLSKGCVCVRFNAKTLLSLSIANILLIFCLFSNMVFSNNAGSSSD